MSSNSPPISFHWQRAVLAARAGDWEGAQAACRMVLAAEPRHVGARLKLSHALLKAGCYRDASDAAVSAVPYSGREPDAILAVARRLRYFEEHELLRVVLGRLELPRREGLETALDAAALASSVGDFELASSFIDRVGGRHRNDARLLYQRGMLATFHGRKSEAEAEFEAAIAAAPDHVQAHWMLARSSPAGAGARLQRVLASARRVAPRSEAAAYLNLALHHELHELARYDEAWEALQSTFGQAEWRPRYDHGAAMRRFSELAATFPISRPGNDVEVPYRPVFIVGMHRSGTSLVERMLTGHPDVADAGESEAFPAQLRYLANHDTREAVDARIVRSAAEIDTAELARRYFQSSRWRSRGRPVLTEKLPHNFLNAGFIAESLPAARIVHVLRDPIDVCFSNLRTFFRGIAGYSYDPVQVAEFYVGYRSLMDHWRQAYPDRLATIDYAELVERPEPVARRVLEHCGLDYDPRVLDLGRAGGAVATASSAQVRAGFDRSRGRAWLPYERQLGPMIDILRRGGMAES